jgi:PAS domain S-box-containing protein
MTQTTTPATIFIVDDDRGVVRLLEKVLQREGFVTAAASSGKEAIIWLARHAADLMLLDLKLPDIEAKELIHHLAEIKRRLPFIIVTGQGDERVAVDMMKRGALDYLVKSVDFVQFVPEVVQRALEQVETERRLGAAEEALKRSEANLAKAQQIAHLGSYEIGLPFAGDNHWSAEVFRIIGLDPTQPELTVQDYVQRVVHPDDRPRVQHVADELERAPRPFELEYRIVRPDGSVRHVQSRGESVFDAKGKSIKLVGTILDITERRRLEREILEISDRERRRIGQDLHDGLGQHLAGIELMSQVLEQNLGRRNKKEAARAAEIARHVREAISQTRALARGLSPVVLESEGLMSALSDLADSTAKMFRVACRFECPTPVLVHDHGVATHLYRVAQEAISNAVKHGKAERIVLGLRQINENILLAVEDNGDGLPQAQTGGQGMGLRIMQYRGPRRGTTVTCSVRASGPQANPQAA